jgi:uridine phosphorylase
MGRQSEDVFGFPSLAETGAEMLMCSRKTVERVSASGGFANGFRSGSLMVSPDGDGAVEAYKVRPECKPHRRSR